MRSGNGEEIFKAIIENQDDSIIRQATIFPLSLDELSQRNDPVFALQIVEMIDEEAKRDMLFVRVFWRRLVRREDAVIAKNRDSLSIDPRDQAKHTTPVE